VNIVPWILIILNVVGAGIMVRFGLPKDIPLIGSEDADPAIGFIGLALFITSIAARIALTIAA